MQLNCLASNEPNYSQCLTDANDSEDVNGPTILLSYGGEEYKKNPLADFMYFVPLISPVSVTSETSKHNQQIGYVISSERKTTDDSFYASCEFRMMGEGSHINEFDHEETIERNKKNVKEGDQIKNILDYIKFQGEGYGKIEITGNITDSVKTVTMVEVHFNTRNSRSPVIVGLYSVKMVNGEYTYKNSYATKVARVNTLVFERSRTTPKMQIKIDSVGSSEESLGLMANIIGRIANFFINPIEISKVGNEEMLKLGLALYEGKSKFTFPKATNLKVIKKKEGSDKSLQ